jgi:hypothetical protein
MTCTNSSENNHQFTLETKPSNKSRPPIPEPEQLNNNPEKHKENKKN